MTKELKKENALEFNKWYDLAWEYAITIETITKLKSGDRIKLLVLDRNVADIAFEINEKDKVCNPLHFFRDNTMEYVHKEGLKGKMVYSYGEYDTEFDIEYELHHWYPLTNGCLPKKDPQGFSKFSYKEPKPWTDFPTNTRIGWRGPMMLWSDVIKMPDIYWE
jgi:hypothetical protein